MNYKDSLTQSFSAYLNNHLTLLQIVSKIINTKLKTHLCTGEESKEKQLTDDQFFRDVQVGISRAKYYKRKMVGVKVVSMEMVKNAQEEMDPLFEIVKERMQTLE